MQVLGEGPARILASTQGGSLRTLRCLRNPPQLANPGQGPLPPQIHLSVPLPVPQLWANVAPPALAPQMHLPQVAVGMHPALPLAWDVLGPAAGVQLTCLAAADEVVVSGFSDGSLRITRMADL
jgi:hypothetical protein